MKYAVLSDVHANMDALEAVTESIRAAGLEVVVCLGDVVGYGPEPEVAVRAIRKLAKPVILGNHDRAAFTEGAEARFNEWAEDAIRWTREQLSEDSLSFLSALELSGVYDGTRLTHATPSNPSSWSYVMDEHDAQAAFEGFEEQLCLIGHTHEPAFFELKDGIATEIEGDSVVMESGRRYIVNVGSVGQPRDGDPRAAYAVVDPDELAVEIVRVEYDATATARKILKAGLPLYLAERLTHGA